MQAARSELGTPFHHQGRAPGAGLDCSGLIQVAILKVGRALRFDRTDYPRVPRQSEFLSDCAAAFDRIDTMAAGVGSILCFWLSERRRTYHFPQHLGMITRIEPDGRVYIIHSIYEYGGVREHQCGNRWGRRVCAAFDVPDVEPAEWPRLGDVWGS